MGFFASMVLFFSVVELGQPGTSVMPVLRIDQGPRFAALGGAGIGAVEDASSIYWNPAGLGRVHSNYYAFSHHQWFADIKDEVLHAAMPSGSGAVGFGLLYSGEPGIEFWDANNTPGDTFRAWNGVLSAGYGLAVAENYCVGAAVKGFYQGLYTSSGSGGAIDLGFACRPLPAVGLGAVARNIGFAKYDQSNEPMPTEAGIGGGIAVGPVNALLDVVLPLDNSVALHAGVEYKPVPQLAVRLGYRTGPEDIGTLGALGGLTAGLGVAVGPLSLDYAVTPYGELGLAHRVGLQATFARKGSGAVRLKVVDGANMQPLSASVNTTGSATFEARSASRDSLS